MLLLILVLAVPATASAQTDFYNTDRGRPLTIEDAVVIERRAFEFQAAPVRFERLSRGVTNLGIAPALAWGLLPRTQLELALPIALEEDGVRPEPLVALAGLEVELLHQLNAESATLPAIALGVGAHLPVGGIAPSRTLATLRVLVTRTHSWGRVHVNGSYTPGAELPSGDPSGDEASRWVAGLAMDRTFVLRSLLVGAEVVARAPLLASGATEWRVGAGLRKQVTPRLAFDTGLGRRVSAGMPTWTVTTGLAYAFGIRGVGRVGGVR